ncbi:MAG: hydantoinase B/oxoprolinase family protein, partial [Rhodospirillaceae bacterium]|nr:hydantoinase B/oxoprolinase family protein [Rhodospirillaceae bacterium]
MSEPPGFSGDPDPFTAEIIQLSLTAITDEMFSSMARAAMSSVIYEVLDFGVAITDARGELASAGAGIPSFVGMLDPAVKAVIGKFGGDVRQGDIFVSNDPYTGGVSHINDVSLTMPVFHRG